MFPNVRVMIVALLASIMGISCGLGALAVLRNNHSSFTRLQSGNPPLQLVFGNGASATVSDDAPAPFGVRFQVIVPLIAPAVASATMSASDQSPPAPVGADSQEASLPDSQQANPTSQQETASDVVLEPAAADQSGPAAAPAADDKPPTAEASSTDAMPAPAPAVTASISPGDTASPEAKPPAAAPETTVAKPARKIVRHIVKLRRPRRPPAATAAQTPNVTSTVTFPSAQQGSALETPQLSGETTPQFSGQTMPAQQQRVVVKRHRPAKKPARAATADQTILGAPSVATTSR